MPVIIAAAIVLAAVILALALGGRRSDSDGAPAAPTTSPLVSPSAVPAETSVPTPDSQAAFGTFTNESGHIYEGELQDSKPHGHGKMTYNSDTLDYYEGEWKNGQRTGTGTMVWKNGAVYEGQWQEGTRHGSGVHTYAKDNENGLVRYEGDWENGKRHGTGTLLWASGASYTGPWEENDIHGAGVYTFADGATLKGTWVDGEQEGQFVRTLANGTVYRQTYKSGELMSSECISAPEPTATPTPVATPKPTATPAPTPTPPVSSSSTLLPDLTKFLNRQPSISDSYRDGMRLKYSEMPYSAVTTLTDEVLALLQQSCYQLKLVDNYRKDTTEKTYSISYYFQYTGSAGGMELLTDPNSDIQYHVRIMVEHYTKIQECKLSMHYCSAFQLADPGSRVSVDVSGGGSGGGGSGGGGGGNDPYIPDHSKLPCFTCGGDGDCNNCNGYSYVWRDGIRGDCTRCSGGKCPTCKGSGTR